MYFYIYHACNVQRFEFGTHIWSATVWHFNVTWPLGSKAGSLLVLTINRWLGCRALIYHFHSCHSGHDIEQWTFKPCFTNTTYKWLHHSLWILQLVSYLCMWRRLLISNFYRLVLSSTHMSTPAKVVMKLFHVCLRKTIQRQYVLSK